MRSVLSASALALFLALPAAAATITLSGVPGAGEVTITLNGSATVGNIGLTESFRGISANTYTTGDSFEFENLIADAALQDVVLPATGSLTITNGAVTSNIVGIFLDDDSEFSSVYDDFGFRVDTPLFYNSADTLDFAGTATIPVDITAFNSFDGTMSFSTTIPRDQVQLTSTVSVVPLPPALALLGGALGVLALRRRRR